ncbi:potassium-transporting ATPase subunit F [Chitinimonas sp. BJB300]
MNAELLYWLVGSVAAGLLFYLFYALINAEGVI